MADQEDGPIPLALPADEAMALAQFCKRVNSETVHSFASPATTYAGKPEGDCMWNGFNTLRTALARAGCAPR
jgi:hypothetical protein